MSRERKKEREGGRGREGVMGGKEGKREERV